MRVDCFFVGPSEGFSFACGYGPKSLINSMSLAFNSGPATVDFILPVNPTLRAQCLNAATQVPAQIRLNALKVSKI